MAGWLTWRNERRWLTVFLALAIAAIVLGVVAWGMQTSSDAHRAYTHPRVLVRDPIPWHPPEVDGPAGAIEVSVEPVEGEFIEGFQVGLRFEDGDGTVLDAAYWTDMVRSSAGDGASSYTTIVREKVPVGTVVVRAQVTLGPGGPPVDPDLEGDLPCEARSEVTEGETVRVQIRFGAGNCLALLPVEAVSATTSTLGG